MTSPTLFAGNAASAHEIILSMAVPGRSSQFVLGCFEMQASIYNQQIRALNLVYALSILGYLRKRPKGTDPRVAVIGGGIAGLTAAAALSTVMPANVRSGKRVSLFEKEPRLLSVVDPGGTAGHRYLDPFLYEWPGIKLPVESHREKATGAPMLGWTAGKQRTVIDQIRGLWQEFESSVAVNLSAQDIELESAPDGRLRIEWRDLKNQGARGSEIFDIVILAVGFGLEKTMSPLKAQSYWSADDLESWVEDDIQRLKRAPRYAVSGAGDGAWTDIFRLVIPDFSQETFIERWLDRYTTADVKLRLARIEDFAIRQQALGRDPSAELTDKYRHLVSQKLVWDLNAKIHAKYKNTFRPEIVLIASKNPISLKSFIANRFLGAHLLAKGPISHWRGHISRLYDPQDLEQSAVTAGPQPAAMPTDYALRALLHQPGQLDGNMIDSYEFDRVLLRHGTEPALKSLDSKLHNDIAPIFQRTSLIDRTRLPAWPAGFFTSGYSQKNANLRPLLTTQLKVRQGLKFAAFQNALQREVRGLLSEKEIALGEELALINESDLVSSGTSLIPQLRAVGTNQPIWLMYSPIQTRTLQIWLAWFVQRLISNSYVLDNSTKFLPLFIKAHHLKSLPINLQDDPSAWKGSLIGACSRSLGIPLSLASAHEWPRQLGLTFLVILQIEPGGIPSDFPGLTIFEQQISQHTDFQLLIVTPEQTKWFPPSSRRLTFESTSANSVNQALESLFEADPTLITVKIAKQLLAPDERRSNWLSLMDPALFSDADLTLLDRSGVAATWAANLADTLPLGTSRLTEVLQLIASESVRNHAFNLDGLHFLTRRRVLELMGDSLPELSSSAQRHQLVEDLVRYGVLIERIEAGFRADSPTLGFRQLALSDIFLRRVFAARHLNHHTDQLLDCLTRLKPVNDWLAVMVDAIRIFLGGKESTASIEGAIEILGQQDPRNCLRLLLELHRHGCLLHTELLQSLTRQIAQSPSKLEDYELLGDIGKVLPGFESELRDLAERSTTPRSRFLAAKAWGSATKTSQSLDNLEMMAAPEFGNRGLRMQALMALNNLAETVRVVRVARNLWLPQGNGIEVTERIQAAHFAALNGDQSALEFLKRETFSTNLPDGAYLTVLHTLFATGEKQRAREGCLHSFSMKYSREVFEWSFTKLIESGYNLSHSDALQKRLRDVVLSGQASTDSRIWALGKVTEYWHVTFGNTLCHEVLQLLPIPHQLRLEATISLLRSGSDFTDEATAFLIQSITPEAPRDVCVRAATILIETPLPRTVPPSVIEILKSIATAQPASNPQPDEQAEHHNNNDTLTHARIRALAAIAWGALMPNLNLSVLVTRLFTPVESSSDLLEEASFRIECGTLLINQDSEIARETGKQILIEVLSTPQWPSDRQTAALWELAPYKSTRSAVISCYATGRIHASCAYKILSMLIEMRDRNAIHEMAIVIATKRPTFSEEEIASVFKWKCVFPQELTALNFSDT